MRGSHSALPEAVSARLELLQAFGGNPPVLPRAKANIDRFDFSRFYPVQHLARSYAEPRGHLCDPQGWQDWNGPDKDKSLSQRALRGLLK